MPVNKNSVEEKRLPEIRRRQVVLPISCGMCLFHRRMAVYDRPCHEMGTPASAETCARFSPDPAQMGDDPGRALRALATSQRPLLHAAALLASSRLRRTKFTLGERAFFLVCGGDYLSNYASGCVVGATSDKLVVAGREGYTALLDESSVLSTDEWFETRRRLLATSSINDPAGGLRRISIRSHVRLVAFTPEELSRPRGKRRGKVAEKRARRKSGVEIINIS